MRPDEPFNEVGCDMILSALQSSAALSLTIKEGGHDGQSQAATSAIQKPEAPQKYSCAKVGPSIRTTRAPTEERLAEEASWKRDEDACNTARRPRAVVSRNSCRWNTCQCLRLGARQGKLASQCGIFSSRTDGQCGRFDTWNLAPRTKQSLLNSFRRDTPITGHARSPKPRRRLSYC